MYELTGRFTLLSLPKIDLKIVNRIFNAEFMPNLNLIIAQSAGVAEYTDCTSA